MLVFSRVVFVNIVSTRHTVN